MTATSAQATCVVCGAPTRTCLDLSRQPMANALLAAAGDPYDAFPLGLARCPECTHGQLTHFLDPSVLFEHYLYASGTSNTLVAFFEWFAHNLIEVAPRGARVLEIACNDGSLMRYLTAEGFEAVGVDPAANLTAVATAAGHDVLTGFFPDVRPDGEVDVVIAMNVAAHTPDPRRFMHGVAEVLAEDGLAIIQTSQALMLGNGEFDTVYHEHYSFYTVASMARLAEETGLRLEQVALTSVHGTSFLFFLRPADSAAQPVAWPATEPFHVAWPDPAPEFLHRDLAPGRAAAVYEVFADRARALMVSVAARVEHHRELGRKIALVGVAAKALTFVRAAGIEPDLYFDEAELKVGRFVPGARTAIRHLADIATGADDLLVILGAWNFADELHGKVTAHVAAAPDPPELHFLVHLPTLREFR